MLENGMRTVEKKSGRNFSKLSRREFLRDAGLVVGGTTMGSAVFAAGTELPNQGKRSPVAETSAMEASPDMTTVKLTVNGEKYRLHVEPHWSLRQILRDEIGLTSPKDWCGGLGACGSCTVILDGRPVLSCLTLACECDGAVIETAEGIAGTEHPVVQSYIKHNAFQCGYCTPGFITTAKALIDKNPDPTEAEVRDALGGNLCRCGTYQKHPAAVMEAAKTLKKRSSI